MIQSRQAEMIPIQDAAAFFQQLWEKVSALADISLNHPLSAKMASATVKRYLVDPSSKIKLRDLIYEETERVVRMISDETLPLLPNLRDENAIRERVKTYEARCENLISIFVTGCHWGNRDQSKPLLQSLQRILSLPKSISGYTDALNLRHFPALLLLYAGGLGALAAGNYDILDALFWEVKFKKNGVDALPFASAFSSYSVMSDDMAKMLIPEADRNTHTPFSVYLSNVLRNPLQDYLPSNEDFISIFDRFEYFWGLAYANSNRVECEGGWRGPIGCFAWRGLWHGGYLPPIIKSEYEKEGVNWAPLRAFHFKDFEEPSIAINRFNTFVGKLFPHYL